MGGVFGAVSKRDIVMDVFFGTDYHSHLGTKRGGMCICTPDGFERSIHNIENSPFRSKFEPEIAHMTGNSGIGSISDGEPQPLTIYSRQGDYAVNTVGRINNKEELVEELVKSGTHQFLTMNKNNINNTELAAALISTQPDIPSGIRYAQDKVDGSLTMLVLTDKGIYAARDKWGRTPLVIGHDDDGFCVASESFSFVNLGYRQHSELGPAEIALITADGVEQIQPPQKEMRICTFLWTYFGYTPSTYEGMNVEAVRYRNGAGIARQDAEEGHVDADYVAGVPDSGIAHALGYANASHVPYSRPLIKYTPTWPRSFMPQVQKARNLIAKMKLIPVHQIIDGKKMILIDDSIVRGTQLTETVGYLLENGAKEVLARSACPPIMYGCKYLNFSRSVSDMDLISRRVICELENCGPDDLTKEVLDEYVDAKTEKHKKMVEMIGEKLNLTDLRFHELDSMLDAVGIDRCKLCTYCWDGKE